MTEYKKLLMRVKNNFQRGKQMAKRKTYTSQEVKERWKKKAYERFSVSFRKDTDQKIIDYIKREREKVGTTEIFRNVFNDFLEK